MQQVVGGIIGATVTLVALYLFIANSDDSSRVIRSLASGYADVVGALQGQGRTIMR